MPRVILMDAETEKMNIPELLSGYTVSKFYETEESQKESILREADAVITVFGKVSMKEIGFAPKLKIIAAAAAGYDSVDVQGATSRGIVVTRAATATVDGVAEHAIGLMISLSKRIDISTKEIRKGNWSYRNSPEAWGSQLQGKTVGVIGFGKVGRSLARKLSALEMKIVVVDPLISNEQIRQSGAEVSSLDNALEVSDYICLTGALTKETFHMIGRREIGKMKESSYLINIARGGMIDEEALYEALVQKRIAGAGLDVLEKEPNKDSHLFSLPNCIVTPHLAGLTKERYLDVGRVAVEDVKSVLMGAKPNPENVVNKEVLRA